MTTTVKRKPTFHLYDNSTVKWEYDGKLYCLHIQQDDMADNPREEWDNITIMACWHRFYNLGDKLDDKEPEDFWRRLVKECVPESEIYAMAEAGNLAGIRIIQNENDSNLVNIYATYSFCQREEEEYLEYENVNKCAVVDYLVDDLTVQQCMTLMKPHAEWMPLWLYDHSGITISCGTRTYPYNDRWDSGCVGWIVALKKTIMKEIGSEYVLNEDGDIKVEHQHDNGPSTWDYKTYPLTDETWRRRAIEIMEHDVEAYDKYLTGDIYGFTLYATEAAREDGPDWNEFDSCWGFYGTDIFENEICECVGCGLKDALLSDQYELGTAELHTYSFYTF